MTNTDYGQLARSLRGGKSATAREKEKTPPKITVIRRVNRRGLFGNIKVVRLFVRYLNARPLVATLNGNVVGTLRREGQYIEVEGVAGENELGVGATESKQHKISVRLENGFNYRFYCGFSTGIPEVRQA